MNKDTGSEKTARNWLFAALPLIVFLALAAIFYKQLADGGASSDLPSALIGRDAPKSELPVLEGLLVDGVQVPALSGELFAGNISLINVWASWCAPCREEHPLLVELGKGDQVQIIGLNYKDKNENAIRFLGQLGNPYDAVGVDSNGRAAIEWGVYGVPETFVVGPNGKIIYKHVGPLNPRVLQETILPIIEKARNDISNSGNS